MKIETNIEKLWEQGVEHHPKSIELYDFISDLDMKNGDTFDFKSGGDRDNGEDLMYLLDIWFETREI